MERASHVGGMMVRLDKTFPTNDCSVCTVAPDGCFLCIRSPRFIDYGGDLKVDVMAGAELVALTGEPGDFTAEVREFPKPVDPQVCTSCGKCAEACPVQVPDAFNEGLTQRKAIYRPHPQSHPSAFVVDVAACNGCGQCEEVCPEHCIDLKATEQRLYLHVGAVILAPGFEPFHPTQAKHLAYQVHPDVVTSVEFERLMSASGPGGGQLRRPSDGGLPKKIAWIQCVGSRDVPGGHPYCSSVCCMYALKQAMLARDSFGEGTEGTVFGMDARVYGKGFERYYRRATEDYGIRFLKSRVFEVDTFDGRLSIRYSLGPGRVEREEFDMVVLSVGLCAPGEATKLAEAAGIETDQYGFCRTPDLSPVATSRPGVFVAGAFAGPKDVPDSVVEGSAAAGAAMALLGGQIGDVWQMESGQHERMVHQDSPRIGVVLCECSSLLSSGLALPEIAEYAATLPGVAWVRVVERACSAIGQSEMCAALSESDVDRVVVGACSSR
ncbi:MAG: 4Fe-4S binding protein, partial [Chloroflexota bacterium]